MSSYEEILQSITELYDQNKLDFNNYKLLKKELESIEKIHKQQQSEYRSYFGMLERKINDLVISGGGGGTGLTATQLSNIAKIPAIQSTVDALPNNYASKNHNHSEYASSSHRHDASEIDNLPSGGGTGLTTEQAQQLQTAYTHSQSDHVTMNEVNEAIANAQLSGGEVDLSGYATKTYVDNTINTAIGDINTILDNINGEVI